MIEQQNINENINPFLEPIERGDTVAVKEILDNKELNPGADNNRAFELAVEKGHFEIVKLLLLDKRVDPAANKMKAIVLAVEHKQSEILKLLILSKRAILNAKLAFFWSIRQGHFELVKLLLLQLSEIDLKTNMGEAIKLAANGKEPLILELLLSDKRIDMNPNFIFGCVVGKNYINIVKKISYHSKFDLKNALKLAAIHGDVEVVKLVLALPRYLSGEDLGNAMKEAAYLGHYEVVEVLLKNKRFYPYNEILSAIKGKHHHIVKVLLSDPRISNRKKMDKCVFGFLIEKNDAESLKILLEKGCVFTDDINGSFSDAKMKVQALRNACDKKDIEVVKVLLQHGCIDIKIQQELFLKACKYKDIKVLEAFIARGCVDEIYKGINYAFEKNQIEVVKFFLQKIIFPPSFRNEKFLMACQNGHIEIINMILSTEHPSSPFDHHKGVLEACKNGHADIVSVLLGHPKPKDVFSPIRDIFKSEYELLAVDPTDDNNAVIKLAAELGYVEVMKVLLKDPRISQETKDEAMRIAFKHKCLAAVAAVAQNQYGFFGHGNSEVLPKDVLYVIKSLAVDLTLGESKADNTNLPRR